MSIFETPAVDRRGAHKNRGLKTTQTHVANALLFGLAMFSTAACNTAPLPPSTADPESQVTTAETISATMPYAYNHIDTLGRSMAYVESGAGDPILFLHGVPTSSYLWRNVMPRLETQGRVIAPDLIGFGESAAVPDGYAFEDHYRHLESFIDELGLQNITLVVHDWGSALGLHYARLHPENIKGLVTMEAIIAPTMPAASYETMRSGSANFFRKVRAPVTGLKLMVEENYFVENTLPGSIMRQLSDEEMNRYRKPFLDPASRPLLAWWPSQMPIGGVPANTHNIVSQYNDWLRDTETPWLLLYASPGVLNPEPVAEYWSANAQNVKTLSIGAGLHYVQEDQPHRIGQVISDWYRAEVSDGPAD